MPRLRSRKALGLILIVQLVLLAKCEEYPDTRYFRNSNLTLFSNDSLLLQINGNTVDFFVIGNQGGIPDPPFYTNMLRKVADLMKNVAAAENTHFQFALGDNFYFDGVTSVDDERFNTTFEDVFDDDNLVQTPWFMTLGNHDYRGDKTGNPLAQIEYMQKSRRWILPNQFYGIDIELNEELLIKALVIDTQLMCDEGTENERYDYIDQVEAKIKEFATTTAPYLFIMGHSPIWSAGFKGSNECLLYALRPIIHKYKVSAYFCADENTMEHFSDSYLDSTVEYVVSGATTFVDERPLNMNKVSNETLRFFWQSGENQFLNCENCSGAIVYAKADKAFINFRFIDTNGNDIYSFNIFPRQPYVPNDTTPASASAAAAPAQSFAIACNWLSLLKLVVATAFHSLFSILK